MGAFIMKLVLAALCFWMWRKQKNVQSAEEAPKSRGRGDDYEAVPIVLFRKVKETLGRFGRMLGVAFIFWALVGTSLIWVPQDHIATLHRVYFGTSLKPGQIVGLRGQLGPQARIISGGFHPELFITLLYNIKYEPVFTVPNGQCAIMSAKDGLPAKSGSAFAAPWPDEVKSKMINDATYFLTEGGGERGPQAGCLLPSSYTINPFLWEVPRLIDVTRIEQGTVGVVKSSLLASVDFGSFKREAPKDNTLRVLRKDQLPQESASAMLVPVGAVGVWEEALPNGLFYINTDAYKITMVPTVAQV
jgi:hypothetical protein